VTGFHSGARLNEIGATRMTAANLNVLWNASKEMSLCKADTFFLVCGYFGIRDDDPRAFMICQTS
jgi:hypothetical protein